MPIIRIKGKKPAAFRLNLTKKVTQLVCCLVECKLNGLQGNNGSLTLAAVATEFYVLDQ